MPGRDGGSQRRRLATCHTQQITAIISTIGSRDNPPTPPPACQHERGCRKLGRPRIDGSRPRSPRSRTTRQPACRNPIHFNRSSFNRSSFLSVTRGTRSISTQCRCAIQHGATCVGTPHFHPRPPNSHARIQGARDRARCHRARCYAVSYRAGPPFGFSEDEDTLAGTIDAGSSHGPIHFRSATYRASKWASPDPVRQGTHRGTVNVVVAADSDGTSHDPIHFRSATYRAAKWAFCVPIRHRGTVNVVVVADGIATWRGGGHRQLHRAPCRSRPAGMDRHLQSDRGLPHRRGAHPHTSDYPAQVQQPTSDYPARPSTWRRLRLHHKGGAVPLRCRLVWRSRQCDNDVFRRPTVHKPAERLRRRSCVHLGILI